MNQRNILRLGVFLIVLIALIGFVMMNLVNSLLFFPDKKWDDDPIHHGFAFEELHLDLPTGERVHGLWLNRAQNEIHTLFLHGNAGNLSHRLHRLAQWKNLGSSFLVIDYPGFGQSSGSPNEDLLYASAHAAYDFMTSTRNVSPDALFVFGESIGGAVAIELASKRELRGLILEATFTNLRELAKIHYPFLPTAIASGMFPSKKRLATLQIPILIVHGEEDEIVPIRMGRELSQIHPNRSLFLAISGAAHNDVYLVGSEEYKEALSSFFRSEIRMKSE